MTEFIFGILIGVVWGAAATVLLGRFRSPGDRGSEVLAAVNEALALTKTGFDLVRKDLNQSGDRVERLHQDVSSLLREFREHSSKTATQHTPRARAQVDLPRSDPERDRSIQVRAGDRDPPPLYGDDWDPFGRPPALGDPPYGSPLAAPRLTPPADAVKVEANGDKIVVSSRQPPEAWLDRSNPAEIQVLLNGGAQLSDPALQRWSTFFAWDDKVPGRAYIATVPAVISWDDSQRVGHLVRPGRARPA